MKTLSAAVVALALASAFCSALAAQSAWGSLDSARRPSLVADKPIFVLVISDGKGRSEPGLPIVRKLAQADKASEAFVLATVNLYLDYTPTAEEKAKGHLNYTKNRDLEEIYGGVTDCALLAPGALKPMFKLKNGLFDESAFTKAKKAYDDWRAEVDKLNGELKGDREKRKDVQFLSRLAEQWATGHASQQANKLLDEALKLLSKEDRAAETGQKLQLRAAHIAREGMDYSDAAKRYRAFQSAHGESPQRAEAQLGLARCLLLSGDAQGAATVLDKIGDEVPDNIRTQITELRALIKSRQDKE